MPDSRLREALDRAAEIVSQAPPSWGKRKPLPSMIYLAGWAEAVEALERLRAILDHEGGAQDAVVQAEDAITKFITAMLGERDG